MISSSISWTKSHTRGESQFSFPSRHFYCVEIMKMSRNSEWRRRNFNFFDSFTLWTLNSLNGPLGFSYVFIRPCEDAENGGMGRLDDERKTLRHATTQAQARRSNRLENLNLNFSSHVSYSLLILLDWTSSFISRMWTTFRARQTKNPFYRLVKQWRLQTRTRNDLKSRKWFTTKARVDTSNDASLFMPNINRCEMCSRDVQ